MSRYNLRYAASRTKATDDSSDGTDKGIAPVGNRSAQPPSSHGPSQLGSRQLRSGTLRPYNGEPGVRTQSKKRRARGEPQPPPKRQKGSWGSRVEVHIRASKPRETVPEDEEVEAAPVDPSFYGSINERTGAVSGTALPPHNKEDNQAEEQLQNEFRDHVQETDEENQSQGEQYPEVAGQSPGRVSKSRRQTRGQHMKTRAAPLQNTRRRQPGSVDLGTDMQGGEKALEEGDGHEQLEPRGSEGDGEAQHRELGRDEELPGEAYVDGIEEDLEDEDGQDGEPARGEELLGEDAAEHEPDSGSFSEDEYQQQGSISLNLPQDWTAPEIIEVDPKGLHRLVKLISLEGWTHCSTYVEEMLDVDNEMEWWQINKQYLGAKRCRPLYQNLYRLLRLWQKMPKVPKFKLQIEYLREHKVATEKVLHSIGQIVVEVVTDIDKLSSPYRADKPLKWIKGANILYASIIPILVLCLKAAFDVGAAESMENEDRFSVTGQFTTSTLQPLLLISKWVKLLYDSRRGKLTPRPDKGLGVDEKRLAIAVKNRWYLGKHLDVFHGNLRTTMAKLEERADAPRRIRIAVENDRRIRATREKEAVQRREADERQMRLYMESRNMKGKAQTSAPQDVYFEKHGWRLWEDERLLDMIRVVLRPRVHELVALVPRRRAEEVVQRVNVLKATSRLKFEAKGMVPPRWCYYPL